jgi:hypothetical protein
MEVGSPKVARPFAQEVLRGLVGVQATREPRTGQLACAPCSTDMASCMYLHMFAGVA